MDKSVDIDEKECGSPDLTFITGSDSSTSNDDNIIGDGEDTQEINSRKSGPKGSPIQCRLVKNIPEKIIFCLDLSREMTDKYFQMGDGSKKSVLDLTKRVLEIFIHLKQMSSKQHEFALGILQDTYFEIFDFTTDLNTVSSEIMSITETIDSTSFDMSSLFDKIEKLLPPNTDPLPPYIVRVIFIYGRSNIIPTFPNNVVEKKLQDCKYFFFDVLYVHDVPTEQNHCQEIYDLFIKFDTKNVNYILEVAQNPTKLHDRMASLLGHPLQRPPQVEANYKLLLEEEEQNVL